MRDWLIHKPKFEADKLRPENQFTPWDGHRKFAYDLMCYIKPEVFVELGAHWGVSFFAFLQAVKDKSIDCKAYAIDSWEGEEHAGKYDDSVYQHIINVNNSVFSNKAILIKKWFDKAVADFDDNSINILHIDGLHTYDATKNDFYTYLPKLADDSLVLFHDVSPLNDYGSKDFWIEIKKQYPHFETDHSWGLGILFPKGDKHYKTMLANKFEQVFLVYKYQYLSELYETQLNKEILTSKQRWNIIESMEDDIKKRNVAIENFKDSIQKRDQMYILAENMIQERDKSIVGMENMIKERDEVISNMENMIKERDKTIFSSETLINEKQNAMLNMENMIKERDKSIVSMENMIKERDEVISNMENMIKERDKAIFSMDDMIKERDKSIVITDLLVNERYSYILKLEAELDEFKNNKNKI